MYNHNSKNGYMKRFVLLFILFTSSISAQNNYTISGLITDQSNGETLFGASIFLEGSSIGTITNEYGFYSITVPEGEQTLVISYMGYADIRKEMVLNENQKLNFEIKEVSTQLSEVVVTAEETERVSLRKPEMSVSKLNNSTVKMMPVVLGEVDIIKSIQMLPGVTKNGEGSGVFHVRGGGADQNLVLLDEAIIYNTSHMLGLLFYFQC